MGGLYGVLGVSADASPEVIRAAYRRRAQAEHPDKGGSSEAWARVQGAYDVLGDGERRARYDATGLVDMQDREARIRSEAVQLVMAAVDGGDVHREDLVARIAQALRGGLAQLRDAVPKAEAAVARRKLAAKRFVRRSGGENFLAQVLVADVESREEMLPKLRAANAEAIAHTEALLAFIEQFDYRVEGIPAGLSQFMSAQSQGAGQAQYFGPWGHGG